MIQKIKINNLKVSCVIGIFPHEREAAQEILLDICLEGDWSQSFNSDKIEDTLDYDSLSKELSKRLIKGQYYLLEKAGHELAQYCLSLNGVTGVLFTIKKPAAIADSEAAVFEIYLP